MRKDVFDTHYDAIFKYILYLTNDRHLAHDLLQETFYRYYQKNYDTNELLYLLKIARNLVYDHFRRRKLMDFITLKKEPPTIAKLPEEVLLQNAENDALYNALQQIKTNYREAVILRYIEQYSVKETADILNTTEAKVKNDTARALKALRALLGGECDV